MCWSCSVFGNVNSPSGRRRGPSLPDPIPFSFRLTGKPQATASAPSSRLRLAVKRCHWIDAEKRTVLLLGLRSGACALKTYPIIGRFATAEKIWLPLH